MNLKEARDVAAILPFVRMPEQAEARAMLAAACHRLGLAAGAAVLAASGPGEATFAEAVEALTSLCKAVEALDGAEGGEA